MWFRSIFDSVIFNAPPVITTLENFLCRFEALYNYYDVQTLLLKNVWDVIKNTCCICHHAFVVLYLGQY